MSLFKQILLISICIASVFATTGNADKNAPQLTTTYHSLIAQDKDYRFILNRYLNSNKESELIVEMVEERIGIKSIVPVLYARDTDGDKKMDLWFIPTSQGTLEPLERNSSSIDGWDAASEILLNTIRISNRPLLTWIVQGANAITYHGQVAENFFTKINRHQMDLYDLESRVDRIRKYNPNAPELMSYYREIGAGWKELERQINDEGIKKYWISVILEEATVGAFAVILKGGSLGLKILAPKIAKATLVVWATELFSAYRASLIRSTYRSIIRLGKKYPKLNSTARSGGALIFSISGGGALALERVNFYLRGMQAKNAVARMTSSAVLTVGKTAKAGLKNWKYGLMTQSIQLLTESVANREEVFDPNPIIMTKKIISNKEMMHNLGYMGNETFWTSGISTLNGNNTKRAYLICGVFSFVDSSAMNFFFKKEFDPKRVTLDTGWEILVGNFQTSQIDIPALDRYERAATQQGKPNLRLVGYAIAIADQTVGYFSYNKASEMVESSKDDEKALKPDVKLIPILAPK